MALRQIVNATSQHVVLRHDLLDVVTFAQPLHTVRRRAAFDERLGDGLVGPGLQRVGQLVQQRRDMIVKRRGIEVSRRRQLPYLLSPGGQQGLPLFADQHCERFDVIHRGRRLWQHFAFDPESFWLGCRQ